MTHLKQISRDLPAKAESLMAIREKMALFTAFADALGTLAESISAWLALGDE